MKKVNAVSLAVIVIAVSVWAYSALGCSTDTKEAIQSTVVATVEVSVTSTPTPTLTPMLADTPLPSEPTAIPVEPTAAPVVIPVAPPSQTCCKICTTGKACGDSCISQDKTCHQPPGCACNG